MQQLIRELWASTGTTILFVTHNTDEALRMGTRIVLLAKESPDQGSRVALDFSVPAPCPEEEIPRLTRKLEGELVA
jgi:NitT/TauT family transport system ATP-binding protein